MLNFLAAVFFGIHMLRTEQISRSTDKKKFLALLSFEVGKLNLYLSTCTTAASHIHHTVLITLLYGRITLLIL